MADSKPAACARCCIPFATTHQAKTVVKKTRNSSDSACAHTFVYCLACAEEEEGELCKCSGRPPVAATSCQNCKRTFTADCVPVALDTCPHTFCVDCVAEMAGKPCVKCHAHFPTGDDGLPVTVTTKPLIIVGTYAEERTKIGSALFLPAVQEARNSPDCVDCARRNKDPRQPPLGTAYPGDFKCLHCNRVVCKECAGTHKVGHGGDARVVRNLAFKTYSETCGRHGLGMIRFCKSCEIPVCGLCVDVGGEHEAHPVEKLVDVREEHLKKLAAQCDLFAQGEEYWTGAADGAAGAIKKIKADSYTARYIVGQKAAELDAAGTERQKQLKFDVEVECKQKTLKLDQFLRSLDGTEAQLQLLLTMIDAAIASDGVTCMAKAHLLAEHTKGLCPTDRPQLPASADVLGLDMTECLVLEERIRNEAGYIDDGLGAKRATK